MDLRQTCWPNERETLLLQAGLCQKSKALEAWHEFCNRTDDIETLDDACYRLFPLVAGNLRHVEDKVPHRNRILGVLRHAWAKNQKLVGEILPLLRILEKAGIKMLLLKGAALANLYKEQGGVRSMADIDILIHPQDLAKTVKILYEQGATTHPMATPERLSELVRFRHELTIKSAAGSEVDIHWYLFADARHWEAEEFFWRDAVPCFLAGYSTQTLHPADQLLHTCLHGAQWNVVSPVRWLGDAIVLIRAGMDWQRLEEQARRLERIEPVRDTLLFLDRLEIDLPPEVVEHWRALEITSFEKMEGGYRTSRPDSRERTKQLAWIYLRLNRDQSLGELLRNAPSYMRQLHHFRAYSRRLTFLRYLLLFFLNRGARYSGRSGNKDA